MKLPNKPKVLAATYNPVSRTKMISFLVDFPTVLLAQISQQRVISQLQSAESEIDYAFYSPVNNYLEKILDNPFVPIWIKQQKGMSGGILTNEEIKNATKHWLDSLKGDDNISFWKRRDVKSYYEQLLENNVHKQNANILLIPFTYTTCILTGTEWEEFFKLKCPQYKYEHWVNGDWNKDWEHKLFKSKKEAMIFGENYAKNHDNFGDLTKSVEPFNLSSAQPEFQVIAEMLYDLYQEADWKDSEFENGSEYHIPFKEDIENLYREQLIEMCGGISGKLKGYDIEKYYNLLMLISASMCAKLSYDTQENVDTLEKHFERVNKLKESKHWEVFSHQAIAMNNEECQSFTKTYLVKEKPEEINGSLLNMRGTVEKCGDSYKVTEHGNCYNLKGFIPQKYFLEMTIN